MPRGPLSDGGIVLKNLPHFFPVWSKFSPNLPHFRHVALSRSMCYNVPDLRWKDRKNDDLSTNWQSGKSPPLSASFKFKKSCFLPFFGIQGYFFAFLRYISLNRSQRLRQVRIIVQWAEERNVWKRSFVIAIFPIANAHLSFQDARQ